jgi:hypothetical protein
MQIQQDFYCKATQRAQRQELMPFSHALQSVRVVHFRDDFTAAILNAKAQGRKEFFPAWRLCSAKVQNHAIPTRF